MNGISIKIAAVVFGLSGLSWGSNCPNGAAICITKVEIEDDSNAGRKSTSTLKMVYSDSHRSATITPTIIGAYEAQYPQWSGTGVTGANGSQTATFTGQSASTVTCTVQNSDGDSATGSANIMIVNESKWTKEWNSNDGYFDTLTTKVSDAISKITKETVSAEVSGSVSLEARLVDKYMDGDSVGVYATASGTLTAAFDDVVFVSPAFPVPGVPGVTLEIGASLSESSCSVGVAGTYDASLASPGQLTATVSAAADVAVTGAAAVAGQLLVITVTGSTSLDANSSLNLVVSGESCSLNGNASFSNSDIVAALDVKVRVFGAEWTPYNGSYTFQNTAGTYTASGTIFQYPDEGGE